MITLYSYFRSSSSYRVRIALHLKGIEHQIIPIDLRKDEHKTPAFQALNPQQNLPVLVDGDLTLSQSLVIINYLDQKYPSPSLLPEDKKLFWKGRELALFIACEMHPLNNLRVLKYLTGPLQLTEDQKKTWYFHWLKEGFDVLEKELACYDAPYALCAQPTLVDLCLIPQMYNARRFGFDLTLYPRLCAIEASCLALDAFQKAAPEAQIDCDI